MEVVVLISIVTLCVVFLGAMVLLIFLCRHKYCKKADLLTEQHQQYAPEQTLVTGMEVEDASGVELEHVTSQGRSIEHILQDDEWVHDATGLAPHCLAILRTCHVLSERLVGMTMRGNPRELCSPETMTDLVATAKRIGPRVDDVVKALYPPLDPRLLEARCTALVLSVSHLVLITKNACRLSGVLDWIDQSLADVDDHLRVLREASINFDEASPQQQQQMMQHSTSYLHNQPTSVSSLANQQTNSAASMGNQATSMSPRASMRRQNRSQPFVLENQLGSPSSNNSVAFDNNQFGGFETASSQPFRFGSHNVFEAAGENISNNQPVNNDSDRQLQNRSPSNRGVSPSNQIVARTGSGSRRRGLGSKLGGSSRSRARQSGVRSQGAPNSPPATQPSLPDLNTSTNSDFQDGGEAGASSSSIAATDVASTHERTNSAARTVSKSRDKDEASV